MGFNNLSRFVSESSRRLIFNDISISIENCTIIPLDPGNDPSTFLMACSMSISGFKGDRLCIRSTMFSRSSSGSSEIKFSSPESSDMLPVKFAYESFTKRIFPPVENGKGDRDSAQLLNDTDLHSQAVPGLPEFFQHPVL